MTAPIKCFALSLLLSIGSLWAQVIERKGLETDTFLGRIAVGVDGIKEDPSTKTTSADLQAGWVFVKESEDFVPTILELRPFLVNRMALREESGSNLQQGVGAGIRFSIKTKEETSFSWYAQVKTVAEYEAPVGGRGNRTEFEIGVEIPLDPSKNGERLARLKRLVPNEYLELNILSLDTPSVSREADHISIVSLYLSWLLEKTARDFRNKIYGSPATSKERLQQIIRITYESLKERELITREEDLLAGKGSVADTDEFLENGIIGWLRENLNRKFHLYLKYESKTEPVIAIRTVFPYRIYPDAQTPEKKYLDASQMVDDFKQSVIRSLMHEQSAINLDKR